MKRVYHRNDSIDIQLGLFITLPGVTKLCPRCDLPIPKPLNEFNHDNKRPDGRYVYCKECTAKIDHARLEQRRERERRKKEENPEYREQLQQKNTQWRHSVAPQRREQLRQRFATDPDYRAMMKRGSRKWRKNNPLKEREFQLRRKARIQETEIGEVSYTRVLERDGMWCYLCSQVILSEDDLSFDHVIPLIPRPGEPQGTHTEDNIKPTHGICNSRKGNRQLENLSPFDRRGPDKVIRERRSFYTYI